MNVSAAQRYAALDRETQVPWLENLELLIRPNDQLSRAVYVSGTYEPASLLAMKRLLPPGGVFLDLGANVGIYSMLASRWVGPAGRVFSFEPSEREFMCLRRHIDLNGLSNVMPLRGAVAGQDGTFELRVAGFPHAGLNTITESVRLRRDRGQPHRTGGGSDARPLRRTVAARTDRSGEDGCRGWGGRRARRRDTRASPVAAFVDHRGLP